jgi:hypothetical protein
VVEQSVEGSVKGSVEGRWASSLVGNQAEFTCPWVTLSHLSSGRAGCKGAAQDKGPYSSATLPMPQGSCSRAYQAFAIYRMCGQADRIGIVVGEGNVCGAAGGRDSQ